MSYFKEVDTAVQEIDVKLDEIEELVAGLPIRPGHKKIIVQQIYDLYTEIEGAVELSAVDYE
jgi:uncharacterized protein YlaN (UPF0358 family)